MECNSPLMNNRIIQQFDVIQEFTIVIARRAQLAKSTKLVGLASESI